MGSPELFNITIRELPNVLKFSKLYQYADDSCILKPIFDEKDIQNFQTDLISINKYFLGKNLKINSSKSVHLRISFRNCDNIQKYKINEIEIPLKTNHKHLTGKGGPCRTSFKLIYILKYRLCRNINIIN